MTEPRLGEAKRVTYVGVVLQVVANGELDPLLLTNHGRSIGRVAHNLQLVKWSDTTYSQERLEKAY